MHHEYGHEILEHRARPGNQRRSAVDGRQSATEVKPMGRRNVPFCNSDKACKPRLRGQEIITTRIEAVVGNAITYCKEFARGIEEKTKIHFVEYRLRELAENREPADQRCTACG